MMLSSSILRSYPVVYVSLFVLLFAQALFVDEPRYLVCCVLYISGPMAPCDMAQ